MSLPYQHCCSPLVSWGNRIYLIGGHDGTNYLGRVLMSEVINTLPPQLTIIKHVIYDNGGTKQASDFTINIVNNDIALNAVQGSEDGTSVTLSAGTFSVSEGALADYLTTYSGDCSGTIADGEQKTCTVTNDYVAPPPPVTKVVFAPGFGGSWNADAILNCKTDGYSGSWILAPFAKSTYKPLLDSLSSNSWDTKEFYYDWRKQIPENGNSLSSFIDTNTIQDEKINLVGHSMGGLVERAYLENSGNSKVDSYYSVGSPHKGTVVTYPAWSAGETWNENILSTVAYTLLLNRCPGYRQNPRQTLQQKISSIQNMLPVFDYLKNYQNGTIKPVGTMIAQNNWLPGNLEETFEGVRTGTLSGNGFPTYNFINVINPSPADISRGNWLDGKPTTKTKTNDGDGTVLNISSRLDEADVNDVINKNHSGLVSSNEGIQKIIDFLNNSYALTLNTRFHSPDTTSSEINSSLIVIGYPANFWVKDPKGNLIKDTDSIVSIDNPKKGHYKLILMPKTDKTLFIIMQLLPNGKTLYKEYYFQNRLPKLKTIKLDFDHPSEDILH